jgi:hypothetical protein
MLHMTRINTSYPDRLYYPMANESKIEIPFPLAKIILTAGLLYLHEYGHALAANLLYKNANPQVTFSVTGGNCTYNSAQLSELGKKFGPSNAVSLVASAGSIVEMIAMLAITVLTRSDKRTAQLMLSKAAHLSIYALSGLFYRACFPGHDFCIIRNSSGDIAYGLLTAACLATTALITRNALRTKQPVMQRAKYTYYPREHQTRRVAPISFYPLRSSDVRLHHRFNDVR